MSSLKIGVIERYRQHLPVGPATPVVSLQEGSTPLLRAPRLAEWAGSGIDLYLKLEGMNPTGSFKDRGMTLAVSKAAEAGTTAILCASTGNTSASAAAYAARAGMKCFVLIPGGKIALGKLAQALMHGAEVLSIDGNFDRALCLVREAAMESQIGLVNSVNPFRLQGQKTAAFEVADALGRSPDIHALPVGNAGNITAYWMGYREYYDSGRTTSLPKMLGAQAAGAAPIVDGAPVAQPETIATAIRIGNPASWNGAVAARDESGGSIVKVTDDEILEAYRACAALEGIFAEPASAAAIAGLRKRSFQGYVPGGSLVVATLTGHGLKDPETAVRACDCGAREIEATREALLRALDLP